jgi:hypothetical protein
MVSRLINVSYFVLTINVRRPTGSDAGTSGFRV